VAVNEVAQRRWLEDYDLVARAIGALDTAGQRPPSVAALAAALHVSTGHLQRTFARFAGTSPARLLRWLTADAARRLLRERHTVLDTTVQVGLSSPGRLHELFVTLDGVTPGEIGSGGAGLSIRAALRATPLGPAAVAETDRGLLSLAFVAPDATGDDVLGQLRTTWPRANVTTDGAAGDAAVAHLAALFDGDRPAERLPVGVVGTNLQLKVWEALLRIPDDAVVAYRDIAEVAGRPDAVRAVAGAIGRNPVATLIPCHRVLRSTGELGGYAWGTTRKRALLAREAARAS
jgi:AraC family transcriptional regulator, regulatory protein of adaptative response / methylated-DNA-[protein]-cysteine methyltransferase